MLVRDWFTVFCLLQPFVSAKNIIDGISLVDGSEKQEEGMHLIMAIQINHLTDSTSRPQTRTQEFCFYPAIFLG